MSKETEQFLVAEQSAQDLLQTLEHLKNEALSYRTSTQELEAVRQKLSELIDSFSPVIKGTHDLITMLRSLGPEILDKLGGVSTQISNESKGIRSDFEQKSNALSEQLNRMKTLVIVALSIAGLSLLGIVVLLL